MPEWAYLTTDEVVAIHAKMIATTGGASGIRDLNLLESAIHAPQASMGGKPLLADPIEIGAAYLFYLCQNHPFLDANKRTALVSCLTFLDYHGYAAKPDSVDWEKLVLAVAEGQLGREKIAARLRKLVRKPKHLSKKS